MPKRTDHAPEAFTVPHFLSYASRLILDSGEPWEVEDFQVVMFKPLLAGVKEVWTVIPEANGKTTAMAGFGLYHCQFTLNPWVPIVASSRDQAEILAQQAYGIIRATPGLEYNKRTGRGYFEILEGYRRIRCYHNGKESGRGIKVYAADVGTSDGGIPTLVLCDEGHRWPDLGPYRLWKGKCGKRKGQIGMTSTAGAPGEEFEEQRDKIRDMAEKRTVDGAFGCYESPNITLTEWMVERPEWVTDMEKVKLANPFSNVSVETLFEEYKSPTTDLGDWKRLKCNIPARTVQAAITETEWSSAYSYMRIPEGVRIDVGLDIAWKHDTTAFVPIWNYDPSTYQQEKTAEGKGPGGEKFEAYRSEAVWEIKPCRLLGEPIILTPPRDGSMLPSDDVKEAFLEIVARNPVDTVIMDLHDAHEIAQWLEDECKVTVLDRPQSNVPQCEDYECFMQGIRTGILKHTGDRGLRKHVMNAIARKLPGDRTRFDRPSQSRAKRKQEVRVIDALTAAAMANWHLDQYEEEDGDLLVAWR
jgi:phage terminase large subunit-like protein